MLAAEGDIFEWCKVSWTALEICVLSQLYNATLRLEGCSILDVTLKSWASRLISWTMWQGRSNEGGGVTSHAKLPITEKPSGRVNRGGVEGGENGHQGDNQLVSPGLRNSSP